MTHAVLTIDDIASKNTAAITDYLKEKGITAVMFAVGRWAKGHYGEAIHALQQGMIVGNHSFSHPAFSQISLEEGIEEIEKNEEFLEGLYRDAGVERKVRPFRFPYGDKGGENREAYQEYFRKKGFDKVKDTQITYPWWKQQGLDRDIDTLWTFDFAEYNIREGSGFTLEDVWKRVEDKDPGSGAPLFAEGGNHIILMHAHDETEALVPEYWKLFIERAQAGGVTFVRPEFLKI